MIMKMWCRMLVWTSILTLCCLDGKGQETITIEQCQQWARENYPLVRQFGLIGQARDYNLANAAKNYLPQLSLDVQASWRSQAVKIPSIEFPEQVTIEVPTGLPGIGGSAIPVDIDVAGIKMPESSKDQYLGTLKATQVLWAGGRIKAAKKAIVAESEVLAEGVETQLHEVKGKINELYFGILLIDERVRQLELVDETLKRVRERVNVALKNGVAFSTDVDVVDVERLKYSQQRKELVARRTAYLEVLSAFVHRPLTSAVQLKRPEEKNIYMTGDSIYRPELRYLSRKKDRLDADYSVMLAENRPQLGVFVVGGYGMPGMSLFRDEFSAFFMGGIRLSWNFGKLYTLKNDKRIIQAKREGVDVERESFIFNTRMELLRNSVEIRRLRDLLVDDMEIVRLRENIKKASEVKYENGVCTMAELIADVNTEAIARQEKIVREIELLMMLYTRGIIAE